MIIDKGNKMALTTNSGETIYIRLEINPRAKRLILRLDEKAREAVAVAPSKRKLGEAAAFARDKVNWIADQLSALPQANHLVPGEIFPLRGEACRISLEGPGRRARLEPGAPQTLHVPGVIETAGRRVERFLRQQARLDLQREVDQHCAHLGVSAKRISVKDTRSRWGSCTSDGRLSFSWRLILAPSEVLSYVAAHECAHLLEMNHSKAFWAHVSKCRPSWKIERAWLREHGRSLHAIKTY